jgi:hypothetical protein
VPAELEWVERFTGAYSVREDPGRERPTSIVLRCTGSLAALVRGHGEVVGSIRAPGLVTVGSLVGTVSLLKGPIVRYAMRTTGDGGTPLLLVLEKRGFRRDAYAALTTLVGEATEPDGRRVAALRLRVDVRGGSVVSELRLRG